jgi:hypothetical protein
MKTSKFLTVIAISGVTLAFVSCSETASKVEESLVAVEEKSMEDASFFGDSCTYSGFLTEAEIEGLMEMREEEKLAHDVYTFFYEKYKFNIFKNISKSEEAHTSAVLRLINGYGLEDPATATEGEFANSLFNELYVSLTEQGSENLGAALKVGAFIEEYDINDLQNLLAETQNEDIIRVYSNLLRGSQNHLRAFTFALTRQNETYTPTVISEEEYKKIIDNSVKTSSEWIPYWQRTIIETGFCDSTGPEN